MRGREGEGNERGGREIVERGRGGGGGRIEVYSEAMQRRRGEK